MQTLSAQTNWHLGGSGDLNLERTLTSGTKSSYVETDARALLNVTPVSLSASLLTSYSPNGSFGG